MQTPFDFNALIESLLIGGVPVMLAVFALVETGKYVGLIGEGKTFRPEVANVVLSLAGAAIWVFSRAFPDSEPVVSVILTALIGALGSALLYQKSGGFWHKDD
jgi:hypothetical protein